MNKIIKKRMEVFIFALLFSIPFKIMIDDFRFEGYLVGALIASIVLLIFDVLKYKRKQ